MRGKKNPKYDQAYLLYQNGLSLTEVAKALNVCRQTVSEAFQIRGYKLMPLIKQSPEDRFWSKVDKSGDCWLWTAGKSHNGYGLWTNNGKNERVHRLVYKQYKGEIPEGMVVCHKCDVRNCVNPDHLFAGTQLENIQDMVKKGRQVVPNNFILKTHCKRGHELSGDNIFQQKTQRRCRTCFKLSRERCRERDKLLKSASN